MKRIFLATIGILGLGFSLPVRSTTYTHNLNYTHNDNSQSSTLTGRITFDDADPNAQDTQEFGADFDTGFITDLTFTYTDSNGVQTVINFSDFTTSRGAEYRINHDGSVNYNVANIKAELTDLAFDSDVDAAFLMTANTGQNFSVDINGVDDFTLNTTTYHSPGPLPLFGLFTAFSSIKNLKSKYKKKFG